MTYRMSSIRIVGMHKVVDSTYDLSNLNYLVGPNGVGKSTVLQAIQLAILGYIPGTSKTKTAIMKHSNGDLLQVSLKLSDEAGNESEISRMWVRQGSSIVCKVTPEDISSEDLIGDLSLPIYDFTLFLGMSSNKQKDWMLQVLPQTELDVNWDAEILSAALSSGVQSICEDFVKRQADAASKLPGEGLDQIRNANEYFRSQLSYLRSTHSRIKSTIQSLIYHDDVDILQDVEQLQHKLRDLRVQQSIHQQELARVEANAQIAAKIDNIQKSLHEGSFFKDDMNEEEAETYYRSCKNALNASLEVAASDVSTIKQEYHQLLIAKDAQEKEIKSLQNYLERSSMCPVLTCECEKLENYASELQIRIEEVKQAMQSTTAECRSSKKSLEDRSAKLIEIQRDVDTLERDYNAFCNLLRLRSQVTETITLSYEGRDFDKEITDLLQTIAKIEANNKYRDTVDSLQSELVDTENEISVIKSLVKITGVNGLQARVSRDDAFDSLTDSMNNVLSQVFEDNSKVVFNATVEGQSFSFGLLRGSSFIEFNRLSSGEQCVFILAFIMSMLRQSKAKLKTILVDDLFDHLDDKNATKLFECLRSVTDIQMIFAGVKNIAGDFVINL